ncbi:YciI family protein [Saccharopolyspora griseoalba]|uniref:YciI family protein n=1 Tax=Saccharopolyspora griseoalba TaxID=1431848 RepID=A0ABW2LGF2_9PSEU
MAYFIETFDKQDSQELRQAHRREHLDYLEENKQLLLACGAKIDDDSGAATGGVYLLDVETRAEAETFIAKDPFTQEGLFAEIRISAWRKAFLDGQSYV